MMQLRSFSLLSSRLPAHGERDDISMKSMSIGNGWIMIYLCPECLFDELSVRPGTDDAV
jgi:hypothetical protein